MSYGLPGGVAARVIDRRVQYTAPQCGLRVLYRLGAKDADPDRRGDIGTVENIISRHGARLPCKGKTTSSWPRTRLPTCIVDCGALPYRGTQGTGATFPGTEFGRRGDPVPFGPLNKCC